MTEPSAPNTPLPPPEDPWNARFGFFWYNDEEIFRDSQEDLDRKAEAMADRGVNHVITFSCTHFRWSFRRHWDQITETLSKVVSACHCHGIYVTEHHSSHLTFNPQNPDEERWTEDVLNIRKSSVSSWPHLREDLEADPVIVDDTRLSEVRQIDGRTGEWARSPYKGWCLCFNNPQYRKAYLRYLETQYQTGIDGIMTDDVQYYAYGHSCACPVCRRLFREKTGHKLPSPGDEWEQWHGNGDDASYLAWIEFRRRSVEDFHQAVKEHYESLGLRPLRPNYCSSMLSWDYTAYCCERCPDLDWISNEFCYPHIVRYSWPAWNGIAAQCFALARMRGIPAGAYIYPDKKDSVLFSWALTRSWGMFWSPVHQGVDHDEDRLTMEKTVREFEASRCDLFREPRKFARLGFYDSRRNRELYVEGLSKRTVPFMTAWMHACYRNNIPFDMFEQEELPDRLEAYRVVVLSEIAILSDGELQAFRAFVERGGTLVWAGMTGSRNENGLPRPGGVAADFWGIEGFAEAQESAEPSEFPVGRGRLLVMAAHVPKDAAPALVGGPRGYCTGKETPFPGLVPATRREMRRIAGFIRTLFRDDPDMTVENAPDDLLVTAFHLPQSGHLVLHLVNATGAFDVNQGDVVGHNDPIPFPRMPTKTPIRITLRKPGSCRQAQFSDACFMTPLKRGELQLNMVDRGEALNVEVPSGLLGACGIVEMG